MPGLVATALVLGCFFVAYYVYETPYRSLYEDWDGTPCGASGFGWATRAVDVAGDSSFQSSQTSTEIITSEPSSSMIPPPTR